MTGAKTQEKKEEKENKTNQMEKKKIDLIKLKLNIKKKQSKHIFLFWQVYTFIV